MFWGRHKFFKKDEKKTKTFRPKKGEYRGQYRAFAVKRID
jgi:hypothetical protein